MWNKTIKVLYFLRIVDETKERLSLTNIALILGMIKIAITPALSMQDISLVLLPLFNYAHKRFVEKKGK